MGRVWWRNLYKVINYEIDCYYDNIDNFLEAYIKIMNAQRNFNG